MTMRIWDLLLPFLGSSERGTRRVSPLGRDYHGRPPVCMGFGESRQGRVSSEGWSFLLGRKNARSALIRKSEPWELVKCHLAFANGSRSLRLAPLAMRGFPVLLTIITGSLLW